jgi:hypothetical protein
MRVIFISSYRLISGYGGGIFLSRAYFEAIRKIFKRKKIILIGSEEDLKICDGTLDIEYVSIKKANIIKKIRLVLFNKALDRMSPEAENWLKKYLLKDDLVIINGALIGRLAKLVYDLNNRNIVVIHHNIEIDFFRENKSKYINSLFRKKIEKIIELNQIIGYKYASTNIFLTETDKKKCRELYGESKGQSVIGPVFLPPDLSACPDLKDINFRKRRNILITGSLNIQQIKEPFVKFIKEELSIIRKEISNIKIILAGYCPDKMLKLFCERNEIELIENPHSMDEIFNIADIYISITEGGSGKKIKIIEALKWGLPIVAHRSSLIGYEEILNNKLIFHYEYIEEIRKILHKLIEKEFISKNERQETQEYFKKTYAFESGSKIFENMFQSFYNKL